jgi:hypothetical protein
MEKAMSVQTQKADPVEILVQETEHLHEQVEKLGDVIGLLSLRQELHDDVSELQGVYSDLTSTTEAVAKASLRLSSSREEEEETSVIDGAPSLPVPLPAPAAAPLAAPALDASRAQLIEDQGRSRVDAKVTLLQGELTSMIADLERQQRRDRTLVVVQRMLGIFFASMVVIVLGLRLSSTESDLVLRNLALILGVGLLGLSAYEAFFDHRSAALKRGIQLARLKNLRRDLVFAVSSADSLENESLMLKAIKRRLDAILNDELKEWSVPGEQSGS